MGDQRASPTLQFIRKIAAKLEPEASELSDGLLLERFAGRQDEAAFAALVARHGPLVLGVCRRLLHHEQDAEDAFQATFLALVRQAGSIAKREAVASWLYGVAYRVACKARGRTARRQARETTSADLAAAEPASEILRRDLAAVLDEEVNRLPQKYRVPFVLCHLEGKSTEQVARLLGRPLGTVSAQLCRARERLRTRLTRRGITLSGGLLAGMLAEGAVSAAVPLALCDSTARAALLMAAGRSVAGGMISARVLGLMQGVVKTMTATKLSLAVLALLSAGVAITGTGTMAYWLCGTEPATAQPAAPSRAATRKEEKARDALAEFKKVYALKPGEDLKRVAPPFPDSRTDYIRSLYPNAPKAATLPKYGAMYLRWDEQDGFRRLGATSPGGPALRWLPQNLASIYSQEIEGNRALLDKVIEGDFIVRKGLSAQTFVKRLEQILRRECNLAVKLRLREEERKVFVARGKYRYTPLAGRQGLQIYGKTLTDSDKGGGGTDDFPIMLQNVGAWVGRRIINEVQHPPTEKVSWHYNFRNPFTDQEHQEDTDATAVLGHLAEQTGLTFAEETRKVRVLFVEE